MQRNEHFSQEKIDYFSLIKKVGDRGCYQWIIFLIGILIWFFQGICVMSITFLFLSPGFDCSTFGVPKLQCQKYICSHFGEGERLQYQVQKEIQSLTTEFGPYYCEKTYNVGFYKTSILIGMTITLIVMSFFINNMSRKKILLICLAIAILGLVILETSSSMLMAVLGLGITGFGIEAPYRYIVSIISQITEESYSKMFISSLYGFFSLGSMLMSFTYRELKNWRQVTLYFLIIPYIIIFILVYFFLEDTPQSLFKSKDRRQITQILNRIGKINKGQDNLVSEEEVQEYIMRELQIQELKEQVNFFDLFRYPSLRKESVAFLFFSFIINLIFYAHSMKIGEVGFNSTLNQLLLSVTELISILILVAISPFIRRKLSGLGAASLGVILSLITTFTIVPPNCQQCLEVFIQMGSIMLTRFITSFIYSLSFVNQSEFYPVNIRSVAFGILGAISCIGSIFSLIVFTDVGEIGVNPFLLVAIFFALIVVCYIWIPETLGQESRDQIKEVEERLFNKEQ